MASYLHLLLLGVSLMQVTGQGIARPSLPIRRPKTTINPDVELMERWNFPTDTSVPDGAVGPLGASSSCRINQNESGFCKPITECPELLKRFRTEEPIRCSFKGDEPVVCCPKPERRTAALIEENNYPDLRVSGCGKRPFKSRAKRQESLAAEPPKNPLVVGGWESIPFSWPWMVALLLKGTHGEWIFHCGAVLIGKRYVLTTAHCFAADLRTSRNPDAAKYAIRIGAHDRDNGTIIGLERIVVHDSYRIRQSYNDIALLRTEEDVVFTNTVNPVCLPGTTSAWRNLEGIRSIVTGWGDVQFGGTTSQVLREVRLTVFPNNECNKNYQKVASSAFPDGISEILLCAGHRRGGKDACQGDSGGPLQYKFENEYSVIGLVSFGYGCAQPGFPGVYTRVSSFLNWIDQNVDGGLN